MLTIELTPEIHNEGEYPSKRLVVNGNVVMNSWGVLFGNEMSGGIYDNDSANEVLNYSFAEIFKNINTLHLPFSAAWCDDLVKLELTDGKYKKNKPSLQFEFRFDSEEWARPWSIAEFAEVVENVVDEQPISGLRTFRDDDEFVTNGFGISCEVDNLSATGQHEVQRWVPILIEVMGEVQRRLDVDVTSKSILQAFRFPEHIAVACEQYLVYFGQFLADLGIGAAVDLSHNSDHVLFRVTPKDSRQALQTIRFALDDYLKMPSDAFFQVASEASNDVAVLQLRANIWHLQSQLTLALATVQTKDAMIQTLQLTNYQLQRIPFAVPSQIKIESETEIKSDSEVLIDGVLSVKRMEFKGIVVHWPEIIRKLKRRLKG